MQLFEKLGFRWDRCAVVPAVAPASVDRSLFRYKQMLAQFVFDARALEGNPFTFPQVQTLMDGVTVGGHKISDAQQVLNLAAAAKELLSLVKSGNFELNKPTFDRLHTLVAKEEAWEWGHFRGEGKETSMTWPVQLGEDEYWPQLTEAGAATLKGIFDEGVNALVTEVPDPRLRSYRIILIVSGLIIVLSVIELVAFDLRVTDLMETAPLIGWALRLSTLAAWSGAYYVLVSITAKGLGRP